jgi:hypothetical protein
VARRAAIAVALVIACHRDTAPAARGALIVDVAPTATRDAIDVMLANAIEVLRSPTLRERAARIAGHPVDGAVVVERRGDSTVLEVGVDLPDPLAAAQACNQLMQAFYELRAEAQVIALSDRSQRVAAMADALPKEDPQRGKLDAELAQLEHDRQLVRSDIEVLERCEPRAR